MLDRKPAHSAMDVYSQKAKPSVVDRDAERDPGTRRRLSRRLSGRLWEAERVHDSVVVCSMYGYST